MKKKQILSWMLSLTMAATVVSIPTSGFAEEEGALPDADPGVTVEESVAPDADEAAAAVENMESVEGEDGADGSAAEGEIQSEARSFNAGGATAKGNTARQYYLASLDDVIFPNGGTITFTDTEDGDITVTCNESDDDWDQEYPAKTVWRNADPSVAKVGYWKDDDGCVSTGSTVTMTSEHEIWLIPQKAGTVHLSVDVYESATGSPVKTLKLNVTISQKEYDKAKYGSYITAATLREADYAKKTLYGKLMPVTTYNKQYSVYYPEISAADLDKLNITVTAGGTTTNATINKSDYTFSGKFPQVKLGTKVVATYTMGSCTMTDDIQVTKWINPTVKARNYTYDGKWHEGSVTVKDGKIKLSGDDYYCTGDSRKDVGRCQYRVWCGDEEDGVWGNYRFKDKVGYFKINPRGTSLKSLKKGKKAITVNWKKQAMKMSKNRVTGYQIQLATNKNFTKNKKLVTVKGYAKTSRKVKNLKKKTRYYVRVRTYMKVGKYTYYSGWSKAKSMKTK